MSYVLWLYLLSVPLLRYLLFLIVYSLCILCIIRSPGIDPIVYVLADLPLACVLFVLLLSDLLVLTLCLYDFDYCLIPIKSSFFSTLCTWVLSFIPLTPPFLKKKILHQLSSIAYLKIKASIGLLLFSSLIWKVGNIFWYLLYSEYNVIWVRKVGLEG